MNNVSYTPSDRNKIQNTTSGDQGKTYISTKFMNTAKGCVACMQAYNTYFCTVNSNKEASSDLEQLIIAR